MHPILVFFILHWYLSLLPQTLFMHRYAAHQMFTMSRRWEKFFFVFSFIMMGPSYLSAYIYGILHRLHHENSDTENDPHSPKYEMNPFRLMWKTRTVYRTIGNGTYKDNDGNAVEGKFKKNLPEWKSFENFATHPLTRITWALLYIGFYFLFASGDWAWFLLLPIQLVMGPFHGFIINYFAHLVGYRNYDMENTSRNFLPVDILMLGESYHNNHHKLLSRPNFGVRWFEIDPIYPIIKILHWLKIIRLKK